MTLLSRADNLVVQYMLIVSLLQLQSSCCSDSNLQLQLQHRPHKLHKLATTDQSVLEAGLPTFYGLLPSYCKAEIMKSTSRLAVILRSAIRVSNRKPTLAPLRPTLQPLRIHTQRQPFSNTCAPRKGLQPDSEDPKPPATEDHQGHHALEPAQIADSEYHELADQYIDTLVLTLEEMAEDAKNGIEVEYSVCVSYRLYELY